MSDDEVPVKKLVHTLPVTVAGQDEQGRTQIIDPRCQGVATVMEDGTVACDYCDAISDLLASQADKLLARWLPEAGEDG